MNYKEIRNALREIPSISKGLKNNNPEAKNDMKRVLSLLATANHQGNAAAGTLSFESLVNHLSKKKATIDEKMQETLGNMATLELAKSFKCKSDFLDDAKVKPLEEI